jgi:hypothetical protein
LSSSPSPSFNGGRQGSGRVGGGAEGAGRGCGRRCLRPPFEHGDGDEAHGATAARAHQDLEAEAAPRRSMLASPVQAAPSSRVVRRCGAEAAVVLEPGCRSSGPPLCCVGCGGGDGAGRPRPSAARGAGTSRTGTRWGALRNCGLCGWGAARRRGGRGRLSG